MRKDKKGNSVLSALKCLDYFTQLEIEQFESRLKQPELRQHTLEEFQLPIKKGMLIKKIILTNLDFNKDLVRNCNDLKSVFIIEQQINLEIKKEDIIKKINKKKIPIQNQWLKDIIVSENIADLNKVIENLPMSIKLVLGKLKYSNSNEKSLSINPIYTPMGNKR